MRFKSRVVVLFVYEASFDESAETTRETEKKGQKRRQKRGEERRGFACFTGSGKWAVNDGLQYRMHADNWLFLSGSILVFTVSYYVDLVRLFAIMV